MSAYRMDMLSPKILKNKSAAFDLLGKLIRSAPIAIDSMIKRFNVAKTFQMDLVSIAYNLELAYIIDSLIQKERTRSIAMSILMHKFVRPYNMYLSLLAANESACAMDLVIIP